MNESWVCLLKKRQIIQGQKGLHSLWPLKRKTFLSHLLHNAFSVPSIKHEAIFGPIRISFFCECCSHKNTHCRYHTYTRFQNTCTHCRQSTWGGMYVQEQRPPLLWWSCHSDRTACRTDADSLPCRCTRPSSGRSQTEPNRSYTLWKE